MRIATMKTKKHWIVFLSVLSFVCQVTSNDITAQVFGGVTDGIPAAFGDFNSDELTDVFITRNGGTKLEILLGSSEGEPFLKQSKLECEFKESVITSAVPGDFNGDAFMDVLVTVRRQYEEELYVHILYGGLNVLNCSFNETHPLIKMRSEPLALDYNNDFIIDLFGLDERNERVFWVFDNTTKPQVVKMKQDPRFLFPELRRPHSNAYLDLNADNIADLFLTTAGPHRGQYQFEVWRRETPDGLFSNPDIIPLPFSVKKIGQSTFMDIELKGKMDHVLPVIIDESTAKLYASSEDTKQWHDLKVDFTDPKGLPWTFFPLKDNDEPFSSTITLRGGDFNMDGYPDLIATLTNPVVKSRTFLLENSPCNYCDNFTRTFKIKWDGFDPGENETVLGVFYDIFQDGILDVILVQKTNDGYRTVAYKNNLDYDANFVKVMVLTGLFNDKKPFIIGALGNRKRTFGTNLPGPRISCKTLDQDGNLRESVSAQLPQSAHYSLNLPYTMFGLGRTPNFVDYLTVGFASKSREWPQLIPNSQMVVIPKPVNEPNKWKMQLFVTPSKLILMSVATLAGTCVVICIVIAALHWNEKKIDRLERLQEAYRFHFDAM